MDMSHIDVSVSLPSSLPIKNVFTRIIKMISGVVYRGCLQRETVIKTIASTKDLLYIHLLNITFEYVITELTNTLLVLEMWCLYRTHARPLSPVDHCMPVLGGRWEQVNL